LERARERCHDSRMPSARELQMVVSSLEPIPAPRTVWLDPYGRLWHGTPEQAAPHRHWRRIGTFLRPTVEAVAAALRQAL
jgi:hypothetical protein